MSAGIQTPHIKHQVVDNCWTYLLQNFHKFTDSNKIRVALAVCTKDMPTELKGELNQKITQMGIVKLGDKTQEVKIGD